ncbi:hypothetical protein KC973_02860, partial [Candidatus Saccharibacteria bacterium]|nr:hypothetical protein [Candidatus Saccharibacteria bacterium]
MSFIITHPVAAADDPADLDGITMPAYSGSSTEYGIWINRTKIALVGSYVLPPSGEDQDHVFSGPGANTGGGIQTDRYDPSETVVYTGDKNSCRKIEVSFTDWSTPPSRGVYKYCDGKTVDIILMKSQNARLDGYITEDDSGVEHIYMPRYIGAIDSCGDADGSVTNSARYYINGDFVDDDGDGKYDIQGTTDINGENPNDETTGGNKKSHIQDLHEVDSNLKTAKQRARSDGTIGDCTMWIDTSQGDAEDSRNIYLARRSYKSIVNSIAAKIDAYRTTKERVDALTAYFDGSQTGRDAIVTCKDKAGGGTWNSMGQ